MKKVAALVYELNADGWYATQDEAGHWFGFKTVDGGYDVTAGIARRTTPYPRLKDVASHVAFRKRTGWNY